MKVHQKNNGKKKLKINPIKWLGVLSYDYDNLYPQRVEQISLSSSTGVNCIRIRKKFIFGNGIADKDLWKMKINSDGLTLDQFVRNISDQIARNEGFAFHVNRNLNYKITEINLMKFKDFRYLEKKDTGKIIFYDDWANDRNKKVKKEDLIEYDLFTNDKTEIIRQIGEDFDSWKGQVYYYTPVEGEYPLSFFDSIIEDLETDSELKLFRKRTVKSNFLGSHILVVGEEQNATVDDEQPNGIDSDPLLDSIDELQGGENAGKIMVVEKQRNEDVFELHKVDIQNYDNLYTNTGKDTKDAIIEGFLQPKALHLKGSSSLGENKELENATKYYNSVTEEERMIISEMLQSVFENWHEKIEGNFDIIPLSVQSEITQEYFPYATRNEIRNSINLPEEEGAKSDQKLLIETLGVGGTQALKEILIDPLLSNEQKVSTLQIVFGISLDNANKLVGIESNTNAR